MYLIPSITDASQHHRVKDCLKKDLINTFPFLLGFSYRESAARISKSIKLRPRTSIQESADWVEYTLAQGGLPHLRPKSLDLPFYKLYLLDVLFVFVVLLIVVFVAVYSVIRCFCRLCFKSNPNKAKSH